MEIKSGLAAVEFFVHDYFDASMIGGCIQKFQRSGNGHCHFYKLMVTCETKFICNILEHYSSIIYHRL